MPEVNFYAEARFKYRVNRGGYQLLIELDGDKEYKKYFSERDLEGKSNSMMMLFAVAVVRGLETLKKSCIITVYSKALFGLSYIADESNGTTFKEMPCDAVNYALKDKARSILTEKGFFMFNIADGTSK